MAITIHVAGLAIINIGAMTTDGSQQGTMNTLGFSMDGVTITERTMTDKVYGDENGGTAGNPIDEQVMGQIDEVDIVFTKWDEAVGANMRASTRTGTPGTMAAVGTLLRDTQGGWQMKIASTNLNRQYRYVKFTEPKQMNAGTKHSQWRVKAVCEPVTTGDTAVLWT